MTSIVVTASTILLLLIALLVLVLMLIKFFMMVWEEDTRRQRKKQLPILEKYIKSPSKTVPKVFKNYFWPLNKILQYTIIYRSFGESGDTLKKISYLYDKLGFIKTDIRRMKSIFWWVRAEGARCLGQMKARKAKRKLLDTLNDKVMEVRLVSAWSLGRIGDARTIKPVLKSLVRSSRLAGMRLSSTVFELGNKAVKPLIEAMSNEDPSIVILAIHLLGELKSIAALKYIKQRAETSYDKEVRVASIKALGNIGLKECEKILIGYLKDDLWEVRSQSAKALGNMNSYTALKDLKESLSDNTWWVQRNAGEALSKLGKRGISALKDIYNKSNNDAAKKVAAEWLDELGLFNQAF